MRDLIFFSLVAGLFSLHCGQEPAGQANVFIGKDWEERTPESQGVSFPQLAEALRYLESQCGDDGAKEVVVIRNGYLIWKGNAIDKVHHIWSVSKVFTSSILGLLVDSDKCALDDPAHRYEPRLWPQYPDATIRHLANFTSGYDGEGGLKWGNFMDGSTSPWVPAPPLYPAGKAYLYWDDAANMLGLVLTKVGGASLYDQFRRGIADPIGIDSTQWRWTDWGKVDGYTFNTGCAFIHISARQLARLGLLYLNRGNWNGRQVISEEWIDQATSVQVPATTPLFRDLNSDPGRYTAHMAVDGRGVYGFHWWNNGIRPDGKRSLPDAPAGTFYSAGHPNNMLFVIPEWKMVLVRLGVDPAPRNRMGVWNAVLKMIGKSIGAVPVPY